MRAKARAERKRVPTAAGAISGRRAQWWGSVLYRSFGAESDQSPRVVL